MYKYEGKLEVSFPEPHLYGQISAQIYEKNGPEPTTIIRTDEEWGVRIYWDLKGCLAEYICGEWCVRVCLESIGDGPEQNWEAPRISLNPCGDGCYYYDFQFKPGQITADYCSTPYKPVVTVTYHSPCYRPGPVAGYVELPILQFYQGKRGPIYRANGEHAVEAQAELAP